MAHMCARAPLASQEKMLVGGRMEGRASQAGKGKEWHADEYYGNEAAADSDTQGWEVAKWPQSLSRQQQVEFTNLRTRRTNGGNCGAASSSGGHPAIC